MQPGPFPTDDDSTAVKMVEEVIAKIEEKVCINLLEQCYSYVHMYVSTILMYLCTESS